MTPINRSLVNPASYKNWGTCVVFPDPVSPAMIKTSLFLIASTMMSSSPIRKNRQNEKSAALLHSLNVNTVSRIFPLKLSIFNFL